MEENVLQESEYRPTSWTQGEPEQGWRSVKEFFSSVVVSSFDLRKSLPSLSTIPCSKAGCLSHGVVSILKKR